MMTMVWLISMSQQEDKTRRLKAYLDRANKEIERWAGVVDVDAGVDVDVVVNDYAVDVDINVSAGG